MRFLLGVWSYLLPVGMIWVSKNSCDKQITISGAKNEMRNFLSFSLQRNERVRCDNTSLLFIFQCRKKEVTNRCYQDQRSGDTLLAVIHLDVVRFVGYDHYNAAKKVFLGFLCYCSVKIGEQIFNVRALPCIRALIDG